MMSSNSEVGHAKNAANLQKLTEQVTAFTLYNPPVDHLKVPQLQALHSSAVAKLAEVEEKRTANKTAIYQRQVAFQNLKPTCTRIINLLNILGLSKGLLDQAKSLNRSIQGSSNKPTTPNPPDGNGGGISTSRQSYTQQAENFGILLGLLATIPNYTPNEDDLKLPNLLTFKESLVSATQPVDKATGEFNVKITERDAIFYTEETGLYDIAQNVKKYVKSLYGGDSPQYSNVSSIKFTNRP